MRGRRFAVAVLVAAALPLAVRAQQGARAPQQEISESQRRLQEIRQERQELRGQLQRIRGQVHEASTELQLIRRQAAVSQSLVRELNTQLGVMQKKIDDTSAELTATQMRLAEKKALLDRRLRDLYKQGPLHAAEVLLSSGSFGELLNRYKYLHLVAQRDRALVRDVESLTRQLTLRELELKRSFSDIQYLQNERLSETQELESMQGERGQTLTVLRRHERSTTDQLEELAADERRLTGVIATLEARRRVAEREAAAAARPSASAAAAPTPAASTLTTADLGSLAWPVGGRLVYRFGRANQANGTALRYNGVGIEAPAGTPVRAVEGGTVEMAAPFEGYGPTVVVSHGGGYYSLYLYLREVQVQQGATVQKGQVIGTVGGEQTPEGAHIEFQIRAPGGQAVDPLAWLRAQGR